MKETVILKRWLALAVTGAVFAVIVVACNRSSPLAEKEEKPGEAARVWPMFGGTLQRNYVNTWDRNIAEKFDVTKGENIKWQADLGSKAYGGPIVAAGKVFVGTNNAKPRDPKVQGDKGILMCFDERTGKFLWQAVHDKLAAGRVNDWPQEGICSSPFVEGDRLYYVNNRAELVCADVNGDPKNPGQAKFYWKLDMIGKLNVFPHNLAVCSPLLVGDTIFVVTANGVDEGHINIPHPKAPSFIAVNKKDGSVAWQKNFPSAALVKAQEEGQAVNIKNLKNQGKILMHGQWSNPVYAEPNGKPMVIFPGGDGWLYALNPKDGEILWKFDCNPKDAIYELGPGATRNDFIGTPVVHDNKVYISVGQDPEHKTGVGHLWCIDITKTPKNKDRDLSPVGSFDPKDPKNRDSALVWHYGGAIPPGVPADRNYYFGRSMSSCAVHDGLCYVADLNGYVYCFDARTGKKYWEEDTQADIWGSPSYVDGKVFIGNDDGNIYVFQHGKEKKLLQQMEAGGKVRGTPVAANGLLFLITENNTRLYCIEKGAQRGK
jgi:outer membrane protein assembly factor BamB